MVENEINNAFQEWERKNAGAFKKERKKEFRNESGMLSKRVYSPLDLDEKGFRYMQDLGFPGEPPYTRGISPTMYRSQMLSKTQYIGHSTPEASNASWRTQVNAGIKNILIAYDLPTQIGYDPDHPMAEGEVGRVGVSMCSLRDWEIGMEGLDLSELRIYQVMNAMYIAAFALHLAMAEKQGVPPSKIQGIGQNDVLKEYIARGNFIFPPRQSMRLATDTVVYAARNLPQYMPMVVCGIHQSERGATMVHEAASNLADAFTYLQFAVERGLDIDLIAPKIALDPSCDPQNIFHEIAKIRAMRKIYARVLREKFGAKKPESLTARFYSGMGGHSLHREQYLNNIARGAMAAFAGACAGCQMIDIRAYDEQFGIPSDEAVTQSIRTMNTVLYESGVCDVVDPLGGSYYVETLTCEFEEKIEEELQKIEEMGGVVKCIETGYFQRQFNEDAYRWQRAFEAGEIVRMGVNLFRSEGQEMRPPRVYRVDPKVEQERIAAVKELKVKRDNHKVKRALDELKAVASAEESLENNLVPPVIEAVKCYATVGEIGEVFRSLWGEYRRPSGL